MNTSATDRKRGIRQLGSFTRQCVLSLSLFLLLLPVRLSDLQAGEPVHEIKLATLAPENSSLMQIFREMNSELLRATGGRLGFKIFAGFILGDEQDVLRKLRIGLIHAATFTDTTLTNVNPDIRVLQIPFLFRNYQEVDYILDRMDDDFRQGFRARGYEVLGWTELGFIYLMSTVPVASVAEMKGKKVWTRAESPMANALFTRADVTPVTINSPDVLVALETNLLEVVYNSPYYALITQWYSRIKYITDLPLAYIGGALIMDSKEFSKLSPQDQETLRSVCVKYMRQVTEKTRKDNEESMRIILRRGVKDLKPAPREVEYFKELLDQTLNDLDPKYLPREVVQKVKNELSQYRSRHGGSGS